VEKSRQLELFSY